MIMLEKVLENPDSYNIVIEAGADFSLTLSITDPEGDAVDLTGYEVMAMLREYPESKDAYSFTTSHNNEGGRIMLGMAAEDTAGIGFSYGVYDVFIESDSAREKILWGKVTVLPAVTR